MPSLLPSFRSSSRIPACNELRFRLICGLGSLIFIDVFEAMDIVDSLCRSRSRDNVCVEREVSFVNAVVEEDMIG